LIGTNNMKLPLLFVLCMLFILPLASAAQNNSILGYYNFVDSLTAFPPLDKEPYIICRRDIAGRFVTFIGFKGEDLARIVAVTLKPVTDIKKEISLTVDFDGVKPTPGKISTWGYIFDRNNDGKVDYMALVGGAAAFKEDDFPDNFPRHGQPLTREQIDYFVGQCKIIFNHYTDDNYDGRIDAITQADMDPQRDWVERKILVRSSIYNDTLDDVRAFRKSPDQSLDIVAHSSSAVPFHPIGKSASVINKKMIDEKTAILTLINHAIEMCGIKPEQLVRRSVK
jgi:hypothetical protein